MPSPSLLYTRDSSVPSDTGDDNSEADLSDDDGDGDDNDGNTGRDSPPRRRMSRAEKLDEVVKTLRRLRWTFGDMIEAWVGANGPQDVQVQHRFYRTQRKRRVLMNKAIRSIRERGICCEVSTDDRCASELDALIFREPFGKFAESMTLDTIDYASAAATIKEVAPTWHALLQRLLNHRRLHQPAYKNKRSSKIRTDQQRIYAITSIICFSRAMRTSNTFSSCLEIFLLKSGLRSRALDRIHDLGFCHSYHQAHVIAVRVAQHAAVPQAPGTEDHDICMSVDASGSNLTH